MSLLRTLTGQVAPQAGGASGLPTRGPRQSVWTPSPAPVLGPQSNARHLSTVDLSEPKALRTVPPQLTWVSVEDALFEARTPADPSEFVKSAHFDFIANALSRGYLPNYRPMCERGEFMNVLEVTEPLIASAELRQALASRVADQSNGRLAILTGSQADFGGNLGKEVVYMALRRHSNRIPFALVPHGFEQHRRVA